MLLETGTWMDGRYKIIRSLGKGSEGSVYLAVQERTYRFYAVKVLEKQGSCFLAQSIELWKRLSHPGLPEIVDVIDLEHQVCVVMEYVEGQTLDRVLDERGIPSERCLLLWGIRICRILEYLHGQNPPVIFGDLKPSNLVLQGERLVLVDLGSAVVMESRGRQTGTGDFFPPWKREGPIKTHVESDLYGLGQTLGFLGSGGRKTPAGEWKLGTASRELKKILRGCTTPVEQERFHTAAECRMALEKLWRRGRTLGGMALLAVFVMAGAMGTLEEESRVRGIDEEYEILLSRAEESSQKEQRELLAAAIEKAPEKEAGYLRLVENFLEDCRLSEEEDVFLRRILKEGGPESNEQQLYRNQPGYGAVAYEIGMAYWYFYEGGGGRSYGTLWFKKALEVLEEDFKEKEKRLRSEIYGEIGSYRAKLEQGSRTGEHQVSFRKYWEDMQRLFQIPASETDGPMAVMCFWKELALQMERYMLEFKNAGVSPGEMETTVRRIRNGLAGMKEEGRVLLEEKEKILSALALVEETLERVY